MPNIFTLLQIYITKSMNWKSTILSSYRNYLVKSIKLKVKITVQKQSILADKVVSQGCIG